MSESDCDIWPPKVGEMIYGLFEDGVFPGEVVQVSNDTVNMDILVAAKVPNMRNESLWKRSLVVNNSKYNQTLHRNSVLPFIQS